MSFNLNKGSALFAVGALSVSGLIPANAWAEVQPDRLMLKPSIQLAWKKAIDIDKGTGQVQAPRSVLANLELFRGVTVDLDPPAHAEMKDRENRESTPSEKSNSPVKALYGGLHIALKDNLSLVYSPGRLTQQGFDSSSQGLYLMTGNSSQASWFMGVESANYARSSDIRRTANTAQFGVILSLD